MTSATDVLRRLLDERGVEWWQKKQHTCWKVGKDQGVEMWRAWEAPDGSLTLKVDYIYDMTPAQAIAATLGRGECHVESFDDGVDEGMDGEWYSYQPPTWYLSCGHEVQGFERPKFCVECGAKVVDE